MKQTTRRLMQALICASLMLDPAIAVAASADKALKEALRLSKEAPEAAYHTISGLAAAGHPRATERLAYFTLKGTGTDPDLDRARDLYAEAVALGYDKALISLAKTQMMAGQAEQAVNSFNRAVALELPNAQVNLLIAHATGRLGALSRPDESWPALLDAAEAGNRTALLGAAYVAGKTKRYDWSDQRVIQKLTDLSNEGDAKATEALLRHYRLSPHHGKDMRATRQALLTRPGIRNRIFVEESLYLTAETQPGQFWVGSETVLSQAEAGSWERGLTITARINRNAYVRIVQKELPKLGYPAGRANGYLHRRTIKAINAFCRDAGIVESCRFGPVKSVAIKAIAKELAKRRTP